jgi:rRNA maturation endonuclease Nob1
MLPMKCPGCAAEVDAEQDFCMECGEPIAQAAVVEVPSVKAQENPLRTTTLPETPAAKRKASPAELVPVRCPGCGVPTTKARCPACGTRLREED